MERRDKDEARLSILWVTVNSADVDNAGTQN